MAEAQVAANEAAFKDAKQDYERTGRLIQSNAVSRAEHENNEKKAQTAKSNLDAAFATREHAQLKLDSKIGGPQTDAVRTAGWLGILLPPLWILALVWAMW